MTIISVRLMTNYANLKWLNSNSKRIMTLMQQMLIVEHLAKRHQVIKAFLDKTRRRLSRSIWIWLPRPVLPILTQILEVLLAWLRGSKQRQRPVVQEISTITFNMHLQLMESLLTMVGVRRLNEVTCSSFSMKKNRSCGKNSNNILKSKMSSLNQSILLQVSR